MISFFSGFPHAYLGYCKKPSFRACCKKVCVPSVSWTEPVGGEELTFSRAIGQMQSEVDIQREIVGEDGCHQVSLFDWRVLAHAGSGIHK